METKSIRLAIEESSKKSLQIIVSAVFFTIEGEYLLQLRDDKIGLPLRNHWALFGGEVEEGEDEYQAIKREIYEELRFNSNEYQWFHEAIYAFPDHPNEIVKKIYYIIPINASQVANMKLCEGKDKKLLKVNEILFLKNISPWDLSTILLHSRQNTIFPKKFNEVNYLK